MRKKILLIVIIMLLTACNNKEETEKKEYLDMKSNLFETKKYTKDIELPCDITINVNRLNKEQVSYQVNISNPKENMDNIKALVVHNYYTEEVFPSVGLFNKSKKLYTNNNKQEDIVLKGKIETTEDIDKLNLEFKVMIKYKSENNKIKDIYYKTT